MMPIRTFRTTLRAAPVLACLLAVGCATSPRTGLDSRAGDHTDEDIEVIPASGVRWGALNPARGAHGPRAADLWGDRTGSDATGMLVRFADGFSSPPHIHNTTYRGVVLEGLIHNDDPDAEESWMPTGSYWTQPAGEVHITSAKGDGRLVFIEIQHGPYLVLPTDEATDNGERAVNIHASNMVWLDASSAARIVQSSTDRPAEGPKVSYLWGDPHDQDPSAALVKLPGGFAGTLRGDGPSLRVVVVEGQVHFQRSGENGVLALDPGSYIGSQSGASQRISLGTDSPCVLYVRAEGALEISTGLPR